MAASLSEQVDQPLPGERVPQRVEEVARVAARQVREVDAVELCDDPLVVRRRRIDDHHRCRFDAEAAEVADTMLGSQRGVLGRRRRWEHGDPRGRPSESLDDVSIDVDGLGSKLVAADEGDQGSGHTLPPCSVFAASIIAPQPGRRPGFITSLATPTMGSDCCDLLERP